MKLAVIFVLCLCLGILFWWFVVVRPTSEATRKDDTLTDTPSQFLDAFGSYEGLKLLKTCWPVLIILIALVIGLVLMLFRWLGLTE